MIILAGSWPGHMTELTNDLFLQSTTYIIWTALGFVVKLGFLGIGRIRAILNSG